jgi:YfiH family protein
VPDGIPRFEVPEWRQRYGVIAGLTARGSGGGRGFDLALTSDAPVGQVMERWEALRTSHPGFTTLILGRQVHGTRVRWYDREEGWVIVDDTDGHATMTPGILLSATVADCVPVYLLAPAVRGVALLHAGWRGTSAGILDQGVERLIEQTGSRPSDIIMHCGIGICGRCYEVGSEVLQAFGLRGDGTGPWQLDLRERLASRGLSLGLGQVSVSEWCTAHDRPGFFSHRASRGRDGRMVAYLGFPNVSQPPAQ